MGFRGVWAKVKPRSEPLPCVAANFARIKANPTDSTHTTVRVAAEFKILLNATMQGGSMIILFNVLIPLRQCLDVTLKSIQDSWIDYS